MIISPESRSERSLSDENGELRAALEQAQRAGDAYKDLLLAAAHEMRTPLHAIGLHLEMVARLSAGDRKEAAQIQIARAKRVLNGYVKRTSMLLDAARIDGGTFSLTEPVSLTDLASAVSELYAANAEFQKTRIEVSVPDVVGNGTAPPSRRSSATSFPTLSGMAKEHPSISPARRTPRATR